jgi:hypothetical protein
LILSTAILNRRMFTDAQGHILIDRLWTIKEGISSSSSGANSFAVRQEYLTRDS